MNEIEKIKQHYSSRDTEEKYKKYNSSNTFSLSIVAEREKIYSKILKKKFINFSCLKVMEIGAGGGGNINFFNSLGVLRENIYANELMENRVDILRKKFSDIKIFPGNAIDMEFDEEFDVVFQSTVFTSVLDDNLRKQLAEKMWNMLRPGGVILWYDFVFSNPWSDYVRKVTRHEVKVLFPYSIEIAFHRVTLAPPIGRRVGSFYNLVNSVFPFLRTHLVAEIHK